MARPTGRPVRDEILAEARTLVQRGGVSGFSYADVAERLGIRAPSIHHHFSRKDELVDALAAEYGTSFDAKVAALDTSGGAVALEAYAELFAATGDDEVLCLCGAVASDWEAASPETQREVRAFFDRQLAWVEAQLRSGVDSGAFRADLDVAAVAVLVLSALEGALLLGRTGCTADPVRTVASALRPLL